MHVDWADVVGSTSDAAFVVGAEGRVAAWNAGMTQLLGVPAGAACGRRCHDLLRARDLATGSFCGPTCPARRASARAVPVGSHALMVRDATGGRRHVRQTVLRMGETGVLLHVLVPLGAPWVLPADALAVPVTCD